MTGNLEKKLIIYISILLGVILNGHKLVVLFPGRNILGNYWVFNLPELLYQSFFNMAVALVVGFVNLRIFKNHQDISKRKFLIIGVGNILFTLIMVSISFRTQQAIFNNVIVKAITLGGAFLRLSFTSFVMVGLARFITLWEMKEQNEQENKRLREAYFKAEINNLKGQINPHFLFNSLSSLSALVREDQEKAQAFINNLSKVFRYSLRTQMLFEATLEEELRVFKAYAELQKIRLEDCLFISINIPQEFLSKEFPVMSLQPLLENAIKHNYASPDLPLQVKVFIEDNFLTMENNLQKNNVIEDSTGIGLSNLSERYRLLYKKEIVITEEEDFFRVSLPLKDE